MGTLIWMWLALVVGAPPLYDTAAGDAAHRDARQATVAEARAAAEARGALRQAKVRATAAATRLVQAGQQLAEMDRRIHATEDDVAGHRRMVFRAISPAYSVEAFVDRLTWWDRAWADLDRLVEQRGRVQRALGWASRAARATPSAAAAARKAWDRAEAKLAEKYRAVFDERYAYWKAVKEKNAAEVARRPRPAVLDVGDWKAVYRLGYKWREQPAWTPATATTTGEVEVKAPGKVNRAGLLWTLKEKLSGDWRVDAALRFENPIEATRKVALHSEDGAALALWSIPTGGDVSLAIQRENGALTAFLNGELAPVEGNTDAEGWLCFHVAQPETLVVRRMFILRGKPPTDTP